MKNRTLKIYNKEIFICEKHSDVLFHWFKYKNEKPYLISFDHHTDTHRAFTKKMFDEKLTSSDKLIKQLSNGNLELINDLKNDEHIDTAIKCEFIEKALLFTVDSSSSTIKYLTSASDCQENTKKRIIINHNLCCQEKISIDTSILEKEFKRFELCIMKSEWENNYILDIDLDFFHYRKSIEVKDNSFFKKLIENAKTITIARESNWINVWKKKDDNELSVDFLEKKLIEIIKETLKPNYENQ